MRERWSKLADAQLKIASLPSGMVVSSSSSSLQQLQPANAPALLADGVVQLQRGGLAGLMEGQLEEAEKACTRLRVENGELKGLVVDAANAVRKIMHKAVSSSDNPDDLEFVCGVC